MLTDVREALRYVGIRTPDAEQLKQAENAARHLESAVNPRFVWKLFPIERAAEGLLLTGTRVLLTGRSSEKMLAECDRCVLLAVTLGPAADTLVRAASARDMTEAVLLDACASALTESGCGLAEKEIRARFPDLYLTDRFSPGYGDLPLDTQPAILSALDAGRRLGLYLTGSLLMNPSKSVTAVIGLAPVPQRARIRGCAYCAMNADCALRKGGHSCA